MLTRWLTVTALLAASANPQTAATSQRVVTVAPTCRVKGHPEEELTLKCGDGKSAGVVQYWHTPFGDLQTPGLHGKMDPVFMHHDGSLVVPNSSVLHSGLYYCLVQHTEETTLWSYKLHISVNNHKNQKDGKDEQTRSCHSVRFRRDVGPEGAASISDGQFAGVVAASVLLTFVLGFSAGALTRAHVLRCLGAVTKRVQSPLQRLRKSDTPDHSSGVTMTTLPPMSDNEAFEVGQVQDITMETTVSSTASSPPAKPQRSFRHKREEPQETTAYLEGCDYMKEEERQLEEEEDGGRKLEEKSEGGEGEGEVEVEEEREFSGFYLLGEGGGSQTETDEEKYSEDGEEKDGRESREQREEEAGEEGSGSREGGEERSEDEAGGSEEQVRDEREEEGREEETEGDDGDDGEKEEDDSSQQSVTETEEEETGAEKQEDKNDMKEGGGEAGICPPRPARRSRVIRLYQYDEDGQRYCHLPDPAPEDPAPPPRLKQRSLSLTRLSAIMAAASAGPLDKGEEGGEDRMERPHFHMEI